MRKEPSFTLGIEEEYLLVDRETGALAEAPDALMQDCAADLEGQVSPEFLQCQIEIGTGVAANIAEAREDLRRLRRSVARHAGDYGLAPIAASCHPAADWKDQHHTDKPRYNSLRRDLGGVVRRLLICGMHVHVGIEEPAMRIDIMNQLSYFLPHLLALSCSSPYWQGEDTGLASYRLTVFDNLPRTGLPPRLNSWDEFERSVDALIQSGVIEDSSKIWWDLRPSSRFPTLETRICDVSPRMETTLTIAATIQCLCRMLWRLSLKNQRWRIYDRFLIGENRWRAQRYGVDEGLIDFGQRQIIPFPDLMEEMVEMLAEDAEALGCTDEIARIPALVANGNSADHQRAIHAEAVAGGATPPQALQQVALHLIEEFHADL